MRLSYTLIFLLLIFNNLYSQSKIYFSSKSQDVGEYDDISIDSISYFTPNGTSVTKDISKVTILFNARGAFLLPSKLDFNDKNVRAAVSNFANNQAEILTTDQVYKNDHSVLKINVSRKDKENLIMQDGTILQKKAIAAVIYKDGRHEIFGPVEKAAEVLWLAYDAGEKTNAKSSVPAKAASENTIAKESNFHQAALLQDTTSKPQTSTNTKAPEPAIKKQDNAVESQTVSVIPSDSLSKEVEEDFKKKAEFKIRQFTDFVKIIMTEDADKANKAIEECAALFMKDSWIEVSSLNDSTHTFGIREYLDRLKRLQYSRIDVTWTNVTYITDIHLGFNNKYYGTISFEQNFKGYRDEKLVYGDRTQKDGQVILETYKRINDGKNELTWDVFLGNISVQKTREIQ